MGPKDKSLDEEMDEFFNNLDDIESSPQDEDWEPELTDDVKSLIHEF